MAPLGTVIVARILLKEPMPSSIYVTTPITLGGLIFICQPSVIFGGTEVRQLSWEGIVFIIADVIVWTATCILVRTAKSAHWIQLQITASVQSILVWCPFLILLNQVWVHSDISLYTVVVMIIIGIFGFFAIMLNVIGYQIGDATKVAWMEYLDLVFAFLYQWLYFKETPTTWEIIGFCALISTCFIHVGEEYYQYWTAVKEKEKENECLFEKEDNSL